MALGVFLVWSTFLMCLLRTGCCHHIDGPTSITITPAPPVILTPSQSDATGGQVSIECRASSVGAGESVRNMSIERVLRSSPNTAPRIIAEATVTSNNGQAALTVNGPLGVSVGGDTGNKSITLTLLRASCRDSAVYRCKAVTHDGGPTLKKYESSRNLTIRVSPGSIIMTTEPSGKTYWTVNDTLIMRCNGIVGSVEDSSQLEWRWQFQYTHPDFPGSFSSWQDYADIGDPDTDISTQNPVSITDKCYKRQTSELTRRLTLDDTGRRYRCYVINRGVPGQSEEDNAQVFSVGTVTESGVTGCSSQADTVKDDKQRTCYCPDAGVIIGAVVAAGVVIDVVILAVVIVFLKRHMQSSFTKSESHDSNDDGCMISSSASPSLNAASSPTEYVNTAVSPENVNTYEGLIKKDVDVPSLYQDLHSPYELPR